MSMRDPKRSLSFNLAITGQAFRTAYAALLAILPPETKGSHPLLRELARVMNVSVLPWQGPAVFTALHANIAALDGRQGDPQTTYNKESGYQSSRFIFNGGAQLELLGGTHKELQIRIRTPSPESEHEGSSELRWEWKDGALLIVVEGPSTCPFRPEELLKLGMFNITD